MVPRILSWLGVGLLGVTLAATSASADVRLAVSHGDVTLFARQASVREILEEWTKVAGTTFIGLEGLSSELITLDLREVPEREALDILLRSASGYIIMPAAADTSIQSQFGSVRVLATSTAQPGAPAWRPPMTQPVVTGAVVTAQVEEADTANSDVPADLASDEVITTGQDAGAPARSAFQQRPGAASASAAAQGRPEAPAGVYGLPAGVAPGEPIGDMFSRPGLIPAWLQDSGSTGAPSGNVTAPVGSVTPGTIAPPQIRRPGLRDSLSDRAPVPPAPVSEPSN
jgi:hypothetical protein